MAAVCPKTASGVVTLSPYALVTVADFPAADLKEMGVVLPAGADDPNADPAVLLRAFRDICLHYFPALAEGALAHDNQH